MHWSILGVGTKQNFPGIINGKLSYYKDETKVDMLISKETKAKLSEILQTEEIYITKTNQWS